MRRRKEKKRNVDSRAGFLLINSLWDNQFEIFAFFVNFISLVFRFLFFLPIYVFHFVLEKKERKKKKELKIAKNMSRFILCANKLKMKINDSIEFGNREIVTTASIFSH